MGASRAADSYTYLFKHFEEKLTAIGKENLTIFAVRR